MAMMRDPLLVIRYRPRIDRDADLPAGFGHPGNETVGGHLAEGDPGHFETTKEATPTPGDTATIHEASGAGITGEHGETHEITSSLQLSAELSVLFDSLLFALVALEPAFFSHRGA